ALSASYSLQPWCAATGAAIARAASGVRTCFMGRAPTTMHAVAGKFNRLRRVSRSGGGAQLGGVVSEVLRERVRRPAEKLRRRLATHPPHPPPHAGVPGPGPRAEPGPPPSHPPP